MHHKLKNTYNIKSTQKNKARFSRLLRPPEWMAAEVRSLKTPVPLTSKDSLSE